MPRILAALALLLSLAACASDESRSFAHSFPYEDALPFEGTGYDGDATDEESMVGPNIRGVIDDDLGLQDGNVF